MNVEIFRQMGERLREERMRISYSQVAFSDACSINRSTLTNWEKGDQSPPAAVLHTMTKLGIDVLYVVTGQRQGETETTLAPEEKALLSAWRNSGEKGRAALGAVAEVLKPD